MNLLSLLTPRPAPVAEEAGQARMNFFDLANLLDNDGNLQVDIIYISTHDIYISTGDPGRPARGEHSAPGATGARQLRGAQTRQQAPGKGLSIYYVSTFWGL